MSRHLTPLMRPTSLQPSLTGPRDVVPGARVHTITTPEERAEDNPPAAAPTNKPKGRPMLSASPNQDAVLYALQKKSPSSRAQLLASTKLTDGQLDMAIMVLNKHGRIAKGGSMKSRLYGLPGTDFSSVAPAKAGAQPKPKNTKPAKPATKRKPKPAPESFADGVKARERELDAKPRSNGTDMRVNLGPDALDAAFYQRQGRNAAAVTDFNLFTHPIHEATALPCRAIATAAGGALITRGNLITAELSAEELNVLHALRG